MVVTFLPSTLEIRVEHERTATPSTCTVQAPHRAMPQPYFVPVRPMVSRSTQSRGVSGDTSTSRGSRFTTKRVVAMRKFLRSGAVLDNSDERRLAQPATAMPPCRALFRQLRIELQNSVVLGFGLTMKWLSIEESALQPEKA